ncbi:MAG: tetratricopeptide repeat protein [Deltaproteobacteria bacterium]|nr:tetratricopeptide repeat protein [Deltaproteobacteria bacterium]
MPMIFMNIVFRGAHIFWILLSIFSSSLCFSLENPAKTMERHLKEGDQFYKEKNYNRAIESYSLALQYTGELKPEAYFKMGLIHYDLGKWDRAITYFDPSYELSQKFAQQAQYFKGLCYYAKRYKSLSKESFLLAKKINTFPVLTQTTESFLKRLDSIKEKKWSLITSLGYGYDSNLTIETTSGIVSDPLVSDEVSQSNSLLLQPSYQVPSGKFSLFTADYRFYTAINWNRGQRGYDLYQQQLSFTLKSPFCWGSRDFQTTSKFLADFSFSGQKEDNSDWVMIGQHYDPSFTLSYAPSALWEWEFGFPFFFKTHFQSQPTWTFKKFPDNLDGRKDIEQIYTLSLLKLLNSYGVSFSTTYVKNDSTVARYDYKRTLLSLALARTF